MNIYLRDAIPADLPALFEHQREPAANHMAAFPARDHDAFMNHWRDKVLGNPDAKKMVIVCDGRIAGNILSWTHHDKRLVGYWLGSEFWHRGIATIALKEFLTRFETTRPLHAFVAVRNPGSIRVLDKCGFIKEISVNRGSDGVEELTMMLS